MVTDVGAIESFDLHCQDGKHELHVEVKGTTTDGHDILLTPNEVEHAKRRRVALLVHSSIALRTVRGKPRCTGGEAIVLDPWRISTDGELRPLGYTYALKLRQRRRT
jgi:hypothetical protein